MLSLLRILKSETDNQSNQNRILKETNNNTCKIEKLNTFSFFWMQLVSFVPIVNLIPLFFWSFNSKVSKTKKSFARSNLIWFAVFVFFVLFLLLTFVFLKYPMDLSSLLKRVEKILINNIKN